MRRFGVYVHFPFCRRRCPYCDFTIAVWRDIPHRDYADAVIAELGARAEEYPGRVLSTLSFGGGTPGAWEAHELGRVVRAVEARFGPAAEISCEANPEDASDLHFAALRAAGVTRLSLGVQSFDPATLRGLGREHSGPQAREAVALAQRHFPAVSLDLILGGPGSTPASLEDDLQTALALGPAHLSVYALTVEPNTQFAKLDARGTLGAPDEDALAAALVSAQERLTGAGFLHYEVSNYARPGAESQHNSLYWTGGEYLGLGCGAHSFAWTGPARGARAVTHKGVTEYLRRARAGLPTTGPHEPVEGEDLLAEMVLSQLRYRAGLDLGWFSSTLGVDLLARGGPRLARLLRDGLAVHQAGRLCLTPRGRFFVDDITLALLATPSHGARGASSTG